jgi:hypothetical protein
MQTIWTFLGSSQIGPLITLAQIVVVPLMIYLVRRINAVYRNIEAIPNLRRDVRKLYRLYNGTRRDLHAIDAKVDLRHAENIARWGHAE